VLRIRDLFRSVAGIAQLVERNLAKVEVEGSSPFSRSNFCLLELVLKPRYSRGFVLMRYGAAVARQITVWL
jgi:hypothetical protein